MSFPTPDSSSTVTQNNSGSSSDDSIFGGERLDVYETYWAVVDTERFLKKVAKTYLFDSPEGVTNADIKARADDSPIAEHYDFYSNEAKEAVKAEIAELRENDEIPKRASLPKYREEFGELEADHEVVTVENAEDFGLNPETFRDDEDALSLPAEYEPVTDDDGNLVVWYETDADETDPAVVRENVLKIAAETDGIGEKTLAAFEENLKKHGY